MTELPTTFGKYYLTEKLATGGMAEIYLAKLIGPGGFEKQLVIKQILPKLSGQRQFVDMFVAEAKTLVALTHGNIVPVYELGVVDDTYYIAMDYIDGPTLYRLTETMSRREARMDPALAAWIGSRILDGLDYAHRKGEGVIHRDLSPRNVMLSRDGDVKLVDFGIAVTLGGSGDVVGRDEAPTGSFPYMSPEQVRREALTPQTDLFSAGVLLWEMLTGERLFQRPDADATLQSVLREAIPRPSKVRAAVPARLDEVVMRALERDRDARWENSADMLAALNKYLYSLDTTPGARDVAALIARYCPPETRRLPTHLEALATEPKEPDATPADDAPAASGPSTAVIPRAPVLETPPKAKGRPQRHKSFATNVDIAPLFEGTGQAAAIRDEATPSTPSPGASLATQPPPPDAPTRRADDEPTTPGPSTAPRRSRRLDAVEEPIDTRSTPATPTSATAPDPDAPIARPRPGMPTSAPPSRGTLIRVGIGALALAVGAIVVFLRGRDQVLQSELDAGVATPADAAYVMVPPPNDASALATPADARLVIDAVAPLRPDAGARSPDASIALPPRADAATHHATRPDGAVPRDAGTANDAATRGSATLTVGADPWGEIYVDGKLMGRTPRELTVPAGHHTVEIVFPAETPPRKQTFAVDLAAGETKPLQADFRN